MPDNAVSAIVGNQQIARLGVVAQAQRAIQSGGGDRGRAVGEIALPQYMVGGRAVGLGGGVVVDQHPVVDEVRRVQGAIGKHVDAVDVVADG